MSRSIKNGCTTSRIAFDTARLGDQRQVRRQRAVLSGASLLVVLVRAEDGVRQQRRTLEHLALVVRAVGDLVWPLGSERLDRLFRELRTAGLREVAESTSLQAMAGRANLLVNLEAALQLSLVELAGEAAERPVLTLRFRVPSSAAIMRQPEIGSAARPAPRA